LIRSVLSLSNAFTSTLGNYSDYEGCWLIGGTGAISIDNIQIVDEATGSVIASENARADVVRGAIEVGRLQAREPAGVRLGGRGDAV